MAKRAMMFRLSDGGYYGIAGLDDKCIHLSTADQVVSTANLYFKGVDDLLLLKFKTDLVEKDEKTELRWEEALPPPGVAPRPGVAFLTSILWSAASKEALLVGPLRVHRAAAQRRRRARVPGRLGLGGGGEAGDVEWQDARRSGRRGERCGVGHRPARKQSE